MATSGYPGLEGDGGLLKPRAAPDLDVDSLVRILGHSTTTDPQGDKTSAEFAKSRQIAKLAIKRLKKLFKTIDIDGNGSVELGEFRKLLMQADSAELGLPACQLEDIFDVADCDRNGCINYKEFVTWLGLGSSKVEDDEEEVMPELSQRFLKFDGPSRTSVGLSCWNEADSQAAFSMAQQLGIWKPPADLATRLAKYEVDMERNRLFLGEAETELLERRLRARGAMRRWVADNYTLSTKAYMTKVDQIEKRDQEKARQRRAFETDPEAAESAQLTGWTLTQKVDKLSEEHGKKRDELKVATDYAQSLIRKPMKEISEQLFKVLFPQERPDPVGPLTADEPCQDAQCSLRSSVDAICVPGEELTVCVNLRIDPESINLDVLERRLVEKEQKRQNGRLQRPTDLLLVLDQSASMEEDIPQLKNSLSQLIENMNSHDRISIISMAETAAVLVDWTQLIPSLHEDLAHSCNVQLSASGRGASYMAACRLLIEQLQKLKELNKEQHPTDSRQKAIFFLSDGRPMEAKDAVFSYLVKGLTEHAADAFFAALALGPHSDGALLSEVCHAVRGAMFYTPDESVLDEVLGQVLAMARSAALKRAFVAMQPLSGCSIVEIENTSSVCMLGPSWVCEEARVSKEAFFQNFRCVVRFESEKIADKLCKFEGAGGEKVYLLEDLREAGERGSLLAGPNATGRVLAKAGQRLLRVRRSHFLAKTAASKKPLEFAQNEGPGINGFEQRPLKYVLSTVSRGPIELEFEPLCWCDDAWTLNEDVFTDSLTVFAGSRLIGYKLGPSGTLSQDELEWPTSGGDRDTIVSAFDRVIEALGTKDLVLVFDVKHTASLVELGNLQHCSSRQVLIRLHVPKSIHAAVAQHNRGHDAVGNTLELPLLDISLGGWLVMSEGAAPRKVQQRLGLRVGNVPSLLEDVVPGRPLTLRVSTVELVEISGADMIAALLEAGDLHQEQVIAHSFRQQGPGIIDVQVQEARGHPLVDLVSALTSEKALQSMAKNGFKLQCPPAVVGQVAFRRLCHWRLARGLKTAADTSSFDLLHHTRNLCASPLAQCLEPTQVAHDSFAIAMAAEAAACEAASEHFECWKPRLYGLAFAHSRQMSPSNALNALEIYGTRHLWLKEVAPSILQTESEFAARARLRDKEPDAVGELEFTGAESDSISVRFKAVDGNGSRVTSYSIRGRDVQTGKVHTRSVNAEDFGGEFEVGMLYLVSLNDLDSDRSYMVVVQAWNGRRGVPSPTLWCSTAAGLFTRMPSKRA